MSSETGPSKVKLPLIAFVLGAIAGVFGTIMIPGLLRPYLPDAIVGEEAVVSGVVTGKRLEIDRLLLTLPTEGGTLLATFTEDIGEIDLMINEGDSLALALETYEPFVSNPKIARVVTRSSPLTARPAGAGMDSAAHMGDPALADSASNMIPEAPGTEVDTTGVEPPM